METKLITKLIDNRNQKLWKEIKQEIKLTLDTHDRQYYLTYVDNYQAKILLPSAHYSIDGFTHELLHLYLRIKRIFITDYLLERLKYEPLLHWSCSETLFLQVGRFLEIVKIIPYYLKMGFDIKMFSEEIEIPPCTSLHIQLMRSGLAKQVPSAASIDLFIYKFFAIKTFSKTETDQTNHLFIMKEIEPSLFNLLDWFWGEWISYDIELYHPVHNSYKEFVAQFMHELSRWAISTIHTKVNMKNHVH